MSLPFLFICYYFSPAMWLVSGSEDVIAKRMSVHWLTET